MSAVDNWRALEALSSAQWTDDAIGIALALPVRTIRKLRLLANIHPAMLDQMERGDMPDERQLRTIAAATREEQVAVWKKHKPKKGQTAVWWQIAQALEKRHMTAKAAKFGHDEEQAFGIVWTEDLFAPADEDSRATTQVDAFLAAQQAWLEANLPKSGVVLATDEYGRPKLPQRAVQSYGKPAKGDTIGCYVDPRTGAVEQVGFRIPKATPKAGKSNGDQDADETPVKSARPDISRKGVELIGQVRTDALHKALDEAEIDDGTLLAMAVLALGGNNVAVERPSPGVAKRADIARRLVQGAVLSRDIDLVRAAARRMLAEVFSCRADRTGSGLLARVAGDAIGADAFLPNMATEELLSCLTKKALEGAASAEQIAPRPRAKDTRAAVIERFAGGTYVLPAARFALTPEELADLEAAEPLEDEEDDLRSGADDAAGDNLADDDRSHCGDDVEAAGDLAAGAIAHV
jgi:ParB family chromosome partitioning protein